MTRTRAPYLSDTPTRRASNNAEGDVALAASGLMVCVDFDLGYDSAQTLSRLLSRNSGFAASDAVQFGRMAVADMCPEYIGLTN